MFTGLVEAIGLVSGCVESPGGRALTIATPLAASMTSGDSVAVNGVCLTVIRVAQNSSSALPGVFVAQAGPETLRVTNLGGLDEGALVNLERPVKADSRMGGHFVLGHVDATADIREVRPDGDFRWIRIGYPPEIAALLILKGSIAVDGISLTIAKVSNGEFDVQIVPFTWEHTNLHARTPGDAVNLECDVLGKYVLRALEARTVT